MNGGETSHYQHHSPALTKAFDLKHQPNRSINSSAIVLANNAGKSQPTGGSASQTGPTLLAGRKEKRENSSNALQNSKAAITKFALI